jgi:hypothetical protein
VQANGFMIEELGCAQVSMNLLDFATTPVWRVWDEVRAVAAEDGVGLRESELIGCPLAPSGRGHPRRRRRSPSEIAPRPRRGDPAPRRRPDDTLSFRRRAPRWPTRADGQLGAPSAPHPGRPAAEASGPPVESAAEIATLRQDSGEARRDDPRSGPEPGGEPGRGGQVSPSGRAASSRSARARSWSRRSRAAATRCRGSPGSMRSAARSRRG